LHNQKVAQHGAISLGYFFLSLGHPKVAQLTNFTQSGHPGCDNDEIAPEISHNKRLSYKNFTAVIYEWAE
jgi:hypothetical protein